MDFIDNSIVHQLEWNQAEQLPFGRGGAATGIASGKLIIAGGTHWQGGTKQLLPDVVAYDLERKVWQDLPPLPHPLFGAASAVWNDRFFLAGGTGSGFTSDVVYRLSPSRQEWIPWTRLPRGLSHSAAAVVGNRLLVLGGVTDGPNFTGMSASVYSVDLTAATPEWKELPPIPDGPRTLFAAAVVRDQVLVFGGCRHQEPSGVINLVSAWSLNPARETWSKLPDVPLATRAWSAASWLDRYVFLFGGYTTRFDARVFCYDTVLATYTETGSLPFPVCDISFQKAGSEFYGAGGEPGARMRSSALLVGRLNLT